METESTSSLSSSNQTHTSNSNTSRLVSSDSISDLQLWPIFSILDQETLNSIDKVCVFGSSGNEAIFITKGDDVYAIGSNCSSCLGLGDTHSSFEPRKIEVLCKKKIIDIAFGSGPHVLAVSGLGEVYSWGHNGYCQLGNGGSSQGLIPVLVTSSLQSKRVVQVACGSHHSMARTQDGDVKKFPLSHCFYLHFCFIAARPCIAIACGQTSSMALIENGEVYGWGYNGNGQLGLGNNVNQPAPCKVTALASVIIHQIVCGYAHTMVLSDEGVMYSWGANSYGQLGTGNKANLVSPAKVNSGGERFISIAASHYSHISAATSQTGNVYMWGQCRGQSITSPLITRFVCTDDVFATFSTPPVSWRTYNVDQIKGNKLAQSIAKAFNDPITGDLKFIIESKEVYVHKCILKIRCDHFRSMFQSCWDEDGKESIEITQYSYVVYKAFLQYLYTDNVDLRPEDAIGLLDLANAYCEPALKKMCELIIKQGITVDNVAMLYAAAIKFEAKSLEEFCFRFAMNHLTEVTQSEAFNNLDEYVLKELIRRAAQAGAFKY
ncbi:hypothetical protein LOTGIDRAFT_214601 [Lottia gigantea]|uniref:BTB domain-containing protein n=1 Tax=Lottia gigantea TaxID=225164 RepID=V4AGK7_LOTGI|nr:hypothetical protein LOTGIDRAFT_214601 [Lottia gigantea]ESO96017.1 hypothetical protein LOTGIDRAFT_214601 [Lottia gigantea]